MALELVPNQAGSQTMLLHGWTLVSVAIFAQALKAAWLDVAVLRKASELWREPTTSETNELVQDPNSCPF